MKAKKVLFYFLIFVSVGYLSYDFLFLGFGYGMMYHHFDYYDDYSSFDLYLRMALSVTAYILIFISVYNLLKRSVKSKHNYLKILNQRLSNGEISIDEYKRIKETIERNG